MRTPTLPGRRRAVELDDALSGRREPRDRVVRDLVRTVDTIRSRPTVTPDPQFTADLRVRVVAAAERELSRLPEQRGTRTRTPAPAVVPLRRRIGLAAAATTFVLVGGGAGLASAATQALPGDLLYPVKRGVEQTQVALDGSDGERGRTLVGQADTRLSELRGLMAGGDQPGNDDLVVDTLHTFSEQAEEGGDALLAAHADGDAGAVNALDDFTVGAGETLTDMSGTLPAEAQNSYAEAAGTVATLQGDIGDVCADCAAPTAVHLPVELLASAETLLPTDGAPGRDALLAGGLPGGELLGDSSLQLPDVDPGDLPTGAGGDPTADPDADPDDPADPDDSGGTDTETPGLPGDDGGSDSGGTDDPSDPGDTVGDVVGDLLGGGDGSGDGSGGGTLGDVGDGVNDVLDDVPTGGPLDDLLGGGGSGDGSGGSGGSGDGSDGSDDGGLLGGLLGN